MTSRPPLSGSSGISFPVSQRLLHLYEAGQLDDAATLARAILEKEPDHFQALHTLGAIHAKRGEFEDAVCLIEQALRIDGKSPFAWNGHGSALRALGHFDEAFASYDKAIALKPDFAQAFHNQAAMLQELGRDEEAVSKCDKALAINPNYLRALTGRADLLRGLGRLDEALDAFDRIIVLEPTTRAFTSRGLVLQKLGRWEAALESYQRAVALDPGDAMAVSLAAFAADQLVSWEGRKRRSKDIAGLVRAGKAVDPFVILHMIDSPALLLEAGANCWRPYERKRPDKSHNGGARAPERLRLGYVSADFRDHPVAHAVAPLFELHDRSRFEVWAISLRADAGPIRKRLEAAADHFIEAEKKSDQEIAALLAANIDIAVDLTGHTEGLRPGIFAPHPSPVAVSYLGYAGSSGSRCMDYILADRHVIPQASRRYYSENLAYLPDTYFVCDAKKTFAKEPASRKANGLPGQGIVFCGFNNAYKITPEVFDIWAGLLKAVENSVLWLNPADPAAIRNLARELEAHSVSAARLVCAPFLTDMSAHLSRLRLADLFLDTMPYNAHSTACDFLYAGVPVVTCMGESFASRVGGSLLHAIGLPELVTDTLQDYAALALKLATDPVLLGDIRNRLQNNLATYPLFDTDRRRRHIEAAYQTMWDFHRRDVPPRTFSVKADSLAVDHQQSGT